MEFLIGFLIGAILILVLKDKPLRIEFKRINEEVISEDIKDAIKEMDKQDNLGDQLYEAMGETLTDINNIMGGGK